MRTVAQALALAVQQHQAGQLPQAEQLYRAILEVEPQQVDALHLLGVLAHQVGQHEQARVYIGQALRLQPDLVEAHLNLGQVLKEQGQLEQARASFQQALRLQPDLAEAHTNLGNVLQKQGQLAEARASYQQALYHKPDYAEAHNNLGAVHQKQGQLAEAQACYRQALRLKPDFAEAHTNLGHVLQQQGQLAEAQTCYQQALHLKPDYAEAHNNLGVILRQHGKFTEAQASYQQALRLKPDYAEAHYNLGNLLREQGELAEAQACYQQALRFQPDYVEAHHNLGVALFEQGELAKAQTSLQEALRLKPNYAEAHLNLGNILQKQGQMAQAQACYHQALHLKPDYAEAHNNLGNVLQDQGHLEEAQTCYEQALSLQPDYAEAHWNRALAWLLAGDFQQGWPEYEWRWQRQETPLPRFPQPLWDGAPLHGRTILLWAEQGLGDTLHFIRYAPLVKERGGFVLVACQPALVPLLSRCPGIDRLLPQGNSLPPFDVYAPLLSLPDLLRTTLATIPATVPYLFADPQHVEYWKQQLQPIQDFKIGIVWQGNPRYVHDRQRSLPLAYFEPLARVEGVRLVSLQKGAGREQLQAVAERFPVIDLGQRLDGASLADAAAAMQNLDLLITSDTALAHLAGALRLPIWVALSLIPDWRWLLGREDSPWYPSMRLFRQQERGNWAEVFARIAAALRQRLTQDSGTWMDSYAGEGGRERC